MDKAMDLPGFQTVSLSGTFCDLKFRISTKREKLHRHKVLKFVTLKNVSGAKIALRRIRNLLVCI